ncbi:luciferase domain-containing protein [Streptomyces chiangmaiensis]|uniref:Luciferase family protein n=1 Tax=Streptomyces chiangmaiensis TaxID=766497 RepID=A0ABU7FEN3_9ACTN|nr:luciferase family protein [Streptomyces chiangmaiensis]MED7822022.1 luciferase family protein [Streptomyces chiangmaiensis]
MTPAQRALERLDAWPDLSTGPASCGIGRALRSSHSEIVHFHTDHEADLHLTSRAIQRISGDLAESTAIRMVPGSRWVTVHLDCDADVDLLLSLVSVALQAHQTRPPSGASPAACNFRRVTVLPRDRQGVGR